jgi:hypothetical protein
MLRRVRVRLAPIRSATEAHSVSGAGDSFDPLRETPAPL